MRAWALAFLLVATTAHAQEEVQCARDAEEADPARTLWKSGKLLQVKEKLLACLGAQACPKFVLADCRERLDRIENEIPTILLHARDARGQDVTRVTVRDGDRVLAEKLDGIPIAIDPGAHVFHFETASATSDVSILVSVGEHRKPIEATFDRALRADGTSEPVIASVEPPIAKPPETIVRRTGWIWPAAITAALGAGALVTYAIAEGTGQSDYNALDRGCGRTGSCNPSDVDSVRTRLDVVAPIALTTGLVLVAASAVMFFVSSRPISKPQLAF